MSKVKVKDALVGVNKLGLDTSPFIYFVEANPKYDALVTSIFRCIDKGLIVGITSVITLTEVLIHPLLHKNVYLQQQYRDLLLYSRNVHTLPIDVAFAEQTAALRARYLLRIPDALQIAVALNKGCEAFLTNDTALRRVTELRVLLLDELEE